MFNTMQLQKGDSQNETRVRPELDLDGADAEHWFLTMAQPLKM